MNEIQSIKTANLLNFTSFPRIAMVDMFVNDVNYGPMDLLEQVEKQYLQDRKICTNNCKTD